MLRWSVLRAAGFMLLAALLAGGITQLISLRLRHGDVYPLYSTFRADPLGVKVFYESVDELPGTDAERNFRSLNHLQPAAPITLVMAGVRPSVMWENGEAAHFLALIRGGSRAVFAFTAPGKSVREIAHEEAEERRAKEEREEMDRKSKPSPSEVKLRRAQERTAEEEAGGAAPKPEKTDAQPAKTAKEKKPAEAGKPGKPDDVAENDSSDDETGLMSFSAAAKKWGVTFEMLKPSDYSDEKTNAVEEGALAGEEPMTWLSALYFDHLSPEWRVLAKCRGKAVVIERDWGKGTIVFASDSYFLSNEALRSERHPTLLTWLLGPGPVIFDEQHLGVTESPGIADLVRRHRLGGSVLAMLLVLVLFVWKNIVRFIPPYSVTGGDGDLVQGRDSMEGFVSLLRRVDGPSAILQRCAGEWRRSCGRDPGAAGKLDHALALAAGRPPAEAYRLIASVLQKPSAAPETPNPPNTP